MRDDSLIDLIPLGVLKLDKSGNCWFANRFWLQFSGMKLAEVKQRGWLKLFQTEDQKRLRDCLDVRSRILTCSVTGIDHWVEIKISNFATDTTSGYILTCYDISEQKELQEQLAHSAFHDRLTGLPNRTLFQDRLYRAFVRAKRQNSLIIVMYMDLDGFKNVNDTIGHDVGDKLLSLFAPRLLECMRETDTVSRVGGDEFTVIMENVTKNSDVDVVAQRILNSLREPFRIGDQNVSITTSIGIASDRANDTNPRQLIKQADLAMYEAKNSGKNTFHYFTQRANNLFE